MLSKLFKSKTIDFNVIVPAIYGMLSAFGVVIPEDVIIGILAIGNFVLRLITSKPITDK